MAVLDAARHRGGVMVVVARFIDERRARRMKGWLRLCAIPARLRRAADDRIELSVRRSDEARALDVLCAIVIGLDLGHLRPTRLRERALEAENVFAAVVAGFVGLVAGIVLVVLVPGLLVAGFVVPLLTAAIGALGGVASGIRRSTGWHTGAARPLPEWAAGISAPPRGR